MFAMSMASIIMLPVFAVPTVLMSIIIPTIFPTIVVPAIMVLVVVVVVAIVSTPVHVSNTVTVNVALFNVTRAEVVVIARLYEIHWP